MAFSNPITGGQGALIRPAIKSPNFLTGVSGWTINRDGSVEFNNGVFRGTVTASTFQGTDFIINTAGFFLYSGPPAAGNLVFSVAPAAGADAFGNAYGQGFNLGNQASSHFGIDLAGNVYIVSGGNTVMKIVPGDGAQYVYSGNAAAGNMVVSLASTAGSDAFANPHPAGITSINPTDFVNLIGSGIFFGQGAPTAGNLALAGWAKSLPSSDVLELLSPFYQGASVAQSQLRLTASTAAAHATAQLLDKSLISPADFLMSGAQVKTDNSGTPQTKQVPGSAPVALNANWTVGAAAIRNTNPLRVWTDTSDTLHLVGAVATLNATPGSTVATLSAPYLPVSNATFGLPQGMLYQMTSAGAFKAAGHCFLTASTGVLSVNNVTFASGDILVFDHHWPLGNTP